MNFTPVIAVAKEGGSPIDICNSCSAGWGLDGKFFYLFFRGLGSMGGKQTVALALAPGQGLSQLPAGGLKSGEDLKGLNVVARMEMKALDIHTQECCQFRRHGGRSTKG